MNEPLPQLFMRKPDMNCLPYLSLPEGFALHTHISGMEPVWESIIEEAFGTHFSFDTCIRNGGGYRPDYVLYISRDSIDIATCTAVEKDTFPGEGWFRMVGTRPSARGHGAGRLVLTAALHSLAARGYRSVVLSTDDSRTPAISLYLSLGFKPLMNHPSHEARWKAVFEELNKSGHH
jgi:ribosomal protein S18 acetylase RimI-like enzyme